MEIRERESTTTTTTTSTSGKSARSLLFLHPLRESVLHLSFPFSVFSSLSLSVVFFFHSLVGNTDQLKTFSLVFHLRIFDEKKKKRRNRRRVVELSDSSFFSRACLPSISSSSFPLQPSYPSVVVSFFLQSASYQSSSSSSSLFRGEAGVRTPRDSGYPNAGRNNRHTHASPTDSSLHAKTRMCETKTLSLHKNGK